MATVTAFSLNIDDTLLPNVTAALNWMGGYQAEVADPNNPGQTIANPVTPQDAAKQTVISYMLNAVKEYQNMQALQAVTPPDSSLIS